MRPSSAALALVLGAALLAPAARADGVPPVTLKIRETESGRFTAQWRVPRQLPASAIPSPAFPETCETVGGRDFTERPGAWFVRQTFACPDGIAGYGVGIEFPVLNATVSTLVTVELLSGDRHTHVIPPGGGRWTVPDTAEGGAHKRFREVRAAVLAGVTHVVTHGVHLALVVALLLAGGVRGSLRLTAAFSGGQVAALVTAAVTGVQLSPTLGEAAMAVAAAVVAAGSLRPPEARRSFTAVLVVAGFGHGLGIVAGESFVASLAEIAGMDATLLVAVAAGAALARVTPARGFRTAVAYAAGIGAIALVVGFPPVAPAGASDDPAPGMRLPDLPLPAGDAAAPASRRVASAFAEAPFQSFVSIGAFEVRHEILVRLRLASGPLGLTLGDTIPVEAQDSVKALVAERVLPRTVIEVDGAALEPQAVRLDFLGIDARGALPRSTPAPEPVADAWLGVTTTIVTERTPRDVVLTWLGIDDGATVPATVTDPESSRTIELTAARPAIGWTNELADDPAPVVTAVEVEPPVAWVPAPTVLLLLGAVACALASARGRQPARYTTLARLALATAALLAPIGNVAVPLPFAAHAAPDPAGAKRILSRLLPNVYRAFEYPTDSAVYDRLERSVTGATLADVYLEHRRAVTMEERGGARARVESVEVADVVSVEPGEDGGFVAEATWTVGGTVTHFGHRHFRQNGYDAKVEVAPVDGLWKIRSIEVLDETRLR